MKARLTRLICLLVVSIIGCKKKYTHTVLDQSLKDKYSWKKDSYWAMVNSASGEPDTLWLTEDVTVHLNYQNSSSNSYESMVMHFIELEHQYDKLDTLLWNITIGPGRYGSSLGFSPQPMHGKSDSSQYYPYPEFYFYPFNPEPSFTYTGKRLDAIPVEEIEIQGIKYSNVYTLKYSTPGDAKADTIIWSNEIGFLKIVQNNFYRHSSRELTFYNIIK